jgi:hypothetical protein
MAAVITGQPSGLENLSIAQKQSPNWELEPLRWLVGRNMRPRFSESTNVLNTDGRARGTPGSPNVF